MNNKPVDRLIDPLKIPAIRQLLEKIVDDAARLRAMWCEHSPHDTMDFENQSVRMILDAPRRGDAHAEAAAACGQQLAEIMDGGPLARADLIDYLVQVMPIDHLRCLVDELQENRT